MTLSPLPAVDAGGDAGVFRPGAGICKRGFRIDAQS
jgi:hypothetical protein